MFTLQVRGTFYPNNERKIFLGHRYEGTCLSLLHVPLTVMNNELTSFTLLDLQVPRQEFDRQFLFFRPAVHLSLHPTPSCPINLVTIRYVHLLFSFTHAPYT